MKNLALIFLILLSSTLIAETTNGTIEFPDGDLSQPLADEIDMPITEPGEFLDVIASIAQYIYAIFFITAVAFILFAAFNYLTGGDEPEKIKTAHNSIKYAAIAIIVALTAVGASLIVKTFLLSAV